MKIEVRALGGGQSPTRRRAGRAWPTNGPVVVEVVEMFVTKKSSVPTLSTAF